MACYDNSKGHVQYFKLEPESELRFQVETKGEEVYLMLKSGFAEVFGTELVIGVEYEFVAGAKIAVFSWQGCTLELKSNTFCYVGRGTPMANYFNCHSSLENRRGNALTFDTRGPVAMVVGSRDVGKSTLCRLLLNYAVRVGNTPFFVDLNVEQGDVAVPGSIRASLIERPASLDGGFLQNSSVVYQFGYKTPSDNNSLFNRLCEKLANSVKEEMKTNKKAKHSGVIINTCGWLRENGNGHLLEVSKLFQVDVVLVLDQERLYHELVRDMSSDVKVVFVPKSGGIVKSSEEERLEGRNHRIREYFYGTPKSPFVPHTFEIKWSDIKLFKIGVPPLPMSCLPYGMKIEPHYFGTRVVALKPNKGMLHHLLAVSCATKEGEDIALSRVAGFVCITDIDVDRQVMTLLSFQPKPLPSTLLVLSELQFTDHH